MDPSDGGPTRTAASIDAAPPWDLTVSPDGRVFLYSQYDPSGSDLMLADNFR